MSTLSTDKESSHDDSKHDRPITLDGDPVIWDRNPATLRGALKEVELFYIREGLFQELLSDRAVLIGTSPPAGEPTSLQRPFATLQYEAPYQCEITGVAQHHATRWADLADGRRMHAKEAPAELHLGQNTLLCPQLHRLLEDQWS